jgi:hypothetical protein
VKIIAGLLEKLSPMGTIGWVDISHVGGRGYLDIRVESTEMPTKTNRSRVRVSAIGEFDRGMLRSAFVSLFWNVIAHKKTHGRYSLKKFSDEIGVNKSAPSRWFSGDRPNWQINTIADIARALDVEVEIRAKDRQTGVIFAPHGFAPHGVVSAESPMERKETIYPVDPVPADIRPPTSPRPPRIEVAAGS